MASTRSVKVCNACGGLFADNEASRRIVTSLDRVLLEVGFALSRGMPRMKETGSALTSILDAFEAAMRRS